MELKKIHQLLRDRNANKSGDQLSLSSSENNETSSFDTIDSKSRAEEVILEDFGDILEDIRLQNSTLYESIKKLNPYQQKAVFSSDKRTLVSAMVGSGKTTVLIHKVLYLHFIKKIPLINMTVLTFTNKAANEIKERIMAFYLQSNISLTPDFSFFGTFHSVARSILVNCPHLSVLGYSPSFTIMDENERKEFFLEIANEFSLNIKYKNKIDKRIERFLDNAWTGRSDVLYGNMKYEDELKYLIEIGQKRKKLNNVMDFDDLIEHANLVLCLPENNFHPQWILVDEFQDSNPKQIELIMNIADENTFIFAVGDPNQLIYAWRGSDLSIFYNFRSKECIEYHLPVNYRSTSSILDVAKHLITYDSKKLLGTREAGVPVCLRKHFDSNQEAIYLANSLKNINNEGVPFREIAVLFRTRRQSEIFETIFEREGIPFEVINRQTLKDIPSLDWLIKLLKACLNKQDICASYSAICNENYGIIEPSSLFVKKYKRTTDKSDDRTELARLLDWLSNNICNTDEFNNFAIKMLYFEKWLENKTYTEIPDVYDYFELSRNLRPTSINYSKDVELVKRFFEEVSMYIEFNRSIDIKSSFLAAINELSLGGHQIFAETIDPNSEKVKLLTMHSAKGLEFRYVFISGANNGLIPLKFSNMTDEQLEEEKRLFFVAMTRAKDYLEISYHTVPEGWNAFPEPSIFINEIPKELLQFNQVEKIIETECEHNNAVIDKFDQWYLGQLIKHPKYGTGTILKISKKNIICNFEKFGEKSFALKFLPILPIQVSGDMQ